MNNIMKTVQALEDSNNLLKRVTKKIKNELREQTVGYPGMLLGTLASTLSGNMLTGRGFLRTVYGNEKRKRNCKNWLWK